MDINERLLIEYRVLLTELMSKGFKKYTDIDKGVLMRKIKCKEDEILQKMRE